MFGTGQFRQKMFIKNWLGDGVCNLSRLKGSNHLLSL